MTHLEICTMAKAANVNSTRKRLKLAPTYQQKVVNFIRTSSAFSPAMSVASQSPDERTPINDEELYSAPQLWGEQMDRGKISMAVHAIHCTSARSGRTRSTADGQPAAGVPDRRRLSALRLQRQQLPGAYVAPSSRTSVGAFGGSARQRLCGIPHHLVRGCEREHIQKMQPHSIRRSNVTPLYDRRQKTVLCRAIAWRLLAFDRTVDRVSFSMDRALLTSVRSE